jgi:hypothetical protein
VHRLLADIPASVRLDDFGRKNLELLCCFSLVAEPEVEARSVGASDQSDRDAGPEESTT